MVMNHLSLAQSFFPNEVLHTGKFQLMTNGKKGQISLKDRHTQRQANRQMKTEYRISLKQKENHILLTSSQGIYSLNSTIQKLIFIKKMCILRQHSEHLALKSRKEVKIQQYDSQCDKLCKVSVLSVLPFLVIS